MATTAQPRLQAQPQSGAVLLEAIGLPAAVAFAGYLVSFVVIMGLAGLGGLPISVNLPTITITVQTQSNTQLYPFLLALANVIGCFVAGLAARRFVDAGLTKGRAALGTALGALLAMALGALLLSLRLYFEPKDAYSGYELISAYNAIRVVGGALVAAFAVSAGAPQLFLAFPITLYIAWIIAPMIATAYISLTNWDGIEAAKFIGLANFNRLFQDANFWTAFGNNVKWLVFFLLIPTTLGLALAMLFNGNFPGSRFFKIAFFSPLILAGTVIGVIWEAMYRPDDGLINSFLHLLGVTNTPGWLADRGLVLWCIVFAAAWRQVGYIMILYLAGLKGLDVTLLEASTVDGASPWERFRHVIFPLLAPITVVVIVISIIDSLRAFDLVAIMTRGGPSYASEVLANFMYMQAFNNYRMGYAGSIAVVLMAVMLVFIIPYLVYTARHELEY